MKKLLTLVCLIMACVLSASAVEVKENLNLAPVAVKTSQGILVSWRALAEDNGVTYTVKRNGTTVATVGATDATSYLDASGAAGDTYTIETTSNKSATCKAWDNMFTKISIPRPAARKSLAGNLTGRYRPDDISVGDVDGDGDYELVVKWEPDNARDSGKDGYASAAYLDCYKMDGTQLWRIDIGDGIRSGNHTTQFLVYDFDGDGKAEVIFKTAPDTKDGKGNYVTAAGDATIQAIGASTVTVNSKGRVTAGAEFLTVFNGQTGAAMKTIFYSPSRSMTDFPTSDTSYSSGWGDSAYNRGERYNAAVAYLDGLDKLPTAIMQRGYYTACYIWAVDWDGTNLTTRWLHKGTGKNAWQTIDGSATKLYDQESNPVYYQNNSSKSLASSYGQGVHGISIGDVDGDGNDEIVIGSATIDNDGKLLCATGFGHGDAIHLAPLCPDRGNTAGNGKLQIMMPHEEKSSFGDYGYDVHDAMTGEVLVSAEGTADNGRGLAANMIPANRNFVFWSSADSYVRDCGTGTTIDGCSKPDTNFRIYWTGDPYDQTFDGRYDETSGCAPRIRSYNTAKGNIMTFQEFKTFDQPQTCNTTKATPCIQADLLGDWREEIIMTGYEEDWSASTCDLLIFSTPEPTTYKVPCLMEDHVYRMGIAWQNSSYNQPPHLGYYLPDYLNITGSSYTTQTESHAPDGTVDPSSENKESIDASHCPSADKEVYTGTSFTCGENEELTVSSTGNYLKVRTNKGVEGDYGTITLNVKEGYKILSVKLDGYSNNTSTTADRSITMVKATADGVDVAESSVVFPGGTAGQTAVTKELLSLNATQTVKLYFDNSKITTSDVDPNGKNAQLFLQATITYEDLTAATEEKVVAPSEDKAVVSGTCYTAGENGEYTNSTSGNYIKVRTNNNGETITYSVKPGYKIVAMQLEGYSNNTSTTADRSITMTKFAVDGTDVAESSLVFPGGTAGQTPVSKKYEDFEATQNIVLSFDNSNITTSDVDANGKNKQLYLSVTFWYVKTTDINEVKTEIVNTLSEVVKFIRNGKLVIAKDGKLYNIAGGREQ